MRLITALLGLTALSKTIASPLVDLERTSLTLDNSKTALDRGELVLHLTRVDDLLDDDQTLLLERQTHIGLRIQLDANAGVVDVNGNKLPLINESADEQGTVAVAVVKAETFSLPTDLPAAFYTPDHVQSLVESVSEGIVAVRVRVESEIVASTQFYDAYDAEEDAVIVQPIPNASLRKIGLFVAIDEIEGKSYKHSKEIFTPILQLLISTELGASGLRIAEVSTLSVGGQPADAEAAHTLDTLPNFNHILPALEEATQPFIEAVDEVKDRAQEKWEQSQKAGGLFNFLKAIFDQPKYAGAKGLPKLGRPCPGRARLEAEGLRGVRKGHALAHLKDSGLIAEHGQKHHQPCLAARFRKGIHQAGRFFIRHFHEMYFLQAVLGVLFFGALFKAIRTSIKRKRAAREYDNLPAYDDLDDLSYGDEKMYAVFVEVPPQEMIPVFDAGEISPIDQMRTHAEKY